MGRDALAEPDLLAIKLPGPGVGTCDDVDVPESVLPPRMFKAGSLTDPAPRPFPGAAGAAGVAEGAGMAGVAGVVVSYHPWREGVHTS